MHDTPPSDASEHGSSATSGASGAAPLRGLLARHAWLGYVAPLIVFLAVTSLEPAPPPAADTPAEPPAATAAEPPATAAQLSESASPRAAQQEETTDRTSWFSLNLPYRAYPYVYTAKIALVIATMIFALPFYRQFPFRTSALALGVGAIGAVLWVGLCHLKLEERLLPAIGLGSLLGSGQRSAYNPFVELAGNPAAAWGFLAVRFVGLVALVPVIEEFFLRGFVMRYCVDERFESVPFGTVNRIALAAGTAVPMLMHPGELIAAACWFSLVTWLMLRTRNIWDCVAAHAVTNLLMGLYAVTTGTWALL